MRVWQNADQLDCLVQRILKRIPLREFELRRQIDSASDSIGANFVEGYYSGSLSEYIRFSKYSKRSLGELRERVRRAVRKEYLTEKEFEQFDDLAIKTMYLLDRLLFALHSKRSSATSSKSAYQNDRRALLLKAEGSRLEAMSSLQPRASSLQQRHFVRSSKSSKPSPTSQAFSNLLKSSLCPWPTAKGALLFRPSCCRK